MGVEGCMIIKKVGKHRLKKGVSGRKITELEVRKSQPKAAPSLTLFVNLDHLLPLSRFQPAFKCKIS